MTADEEATLFCRGSTRRDGKVERYTKSCFFFSCDVSEEDCRNQ